MNIFATDRDPIIAATNLCDKHVVKMITECKQMLSGVAIRYGYKADYLFKASKSQQHHPCTIWAGNSYGNFIWLIDHAIAISHEYTKRYSKIHASSVGLSEFGSLIPANVFPVQELQEFVQSMPDQYRNIDPIIGYRTFYIKDKSRFAKWRYTNPPSWFEGT